MMRPPPTLASLQPLGIPDPPPLPREERPTLAPPAAMRAKEAA